MRRNVVPLTIAILMLALFWWTRTGEPPSLRHDVSSDVRTCTSNLQAIYDGLRAYNDRFGRPPSGSGVAFFAELVSAGIWEDSPEARERLTCPGSGATPVPDATDFAQLASLTNASSAYAGRDSAAFPLTTFPAGGPDNTALVACDNAHGMNHDGVMNVLFTDRTIQALYLDQLIESGALPPGTETIVVGPDSPLEELRVLSADAGE